MWFSSPSAEGRRCTENCGGTWERCRKLAEQKESRIEEGYLMPDHVRMMIAIPPKYAVSQVIGFIKGRARFTWRGCTERGSETLSGSISGRGGTGCRR